MVLSISEASNNLVSPQSDQATEHPEPGVHPEEEAVRAAGAQLLDPEEAGEERAAPHPPAADQHAIPEDGSAGKNQLAYDMVLCSGPPEAVGRFSTRSCK